jgi:hypothetical protein
MTPTLMLLSLLACGEEAADCPTCPACPEPAAAPPGDGTTLSSWETELLGSQLHDLRAGVRPTGDQGWGLCAGADACADFLGPTPGVLKAGSYRLRAELAVPALGEGWQVALERTCDDGSKPYTRSFSVRHAGEGRGYRLDPLIRFDVAADGGPKACTATLTPIRPDGQPMQALEARWSSGG